MDVADGGSLSQVTKQIASIAVMRNLAGSLLLLEHLECRS